MVYGIVETTLLGYPAICETNSVTSGFRGISVSWRLSHLSQNHPMWPTQGSHSERLHGLSSMASGTELLGRFSSSNAGFSTNVWFFHGISMMIMVRNWRCSIRTDRFGSCRVDAVSFFESIGWWCWLGESPLQSYQHVQTIDIIVPSRCWIFLHRVSYTSYTFHSKSMKTILKFENLKDTFHDSRPFQTTHWGWTFGPRSRRSGV